MSIPPRCSLPLPEPKPTAFLIWQTLDGSLLNLPRHLSSPSNLATIVYSAVFGAVAYFELIGACVPLVHLPDMASVSFPPPKLISALGPPHRRFRHKTSPGHTGRNLGRI